MYIIPEMNSVMSKMTKAPTTTNRDMHHYVYGDPSYCFLGVLLVRDFKEGNEMLYGFIKVGGN